MIHPVQPEVAGLKFSQDSQIFSLNYLMRCLAKLLMP